MPVLIGTPAGFEPAAYEFGVFQKFLNYLLSKGLISILSDVIIVKAITK